MEENNAAIEATDLVSDDDVRQLLSRTMQAQQLLKQGYGVREVSTMLSIPYGMISDLKQEMGIQPKTVTKKERTRKQKRKSQKVARRNNRR